MTLGSEFQKNRKKRRKKYFCTLRSYEATHVLWASWGSIPSASLELHQLQYHFRGRQMVITSGWLIWQYDHVSHEVGRSTWPSTVLWMPPVPPTGGESLSNVYIYIFFFLIFIHMHRVYTNINDLNIIYVYICILHKCSAMLQIVDVFKCFWLTLMESYGKYVESMWKSLFLCPWRSNALHTRTPAAPLSVFGGHTFRLDPTFKSVRCIRCISWGGYEWTAQLDATHLEPGMGH